MKILVGYDTTPESEYILSDIERAGLPEDAQFLIVIATDMEPFPVEFETGLADVLHPSPKDTWQRKLSADERGFLDRMMQGARQRATDKSSELAAGAAPAVEQLKRSFPKGRVANEVIMECPYFAITDQAKRNGADLIVVGCHEASALRRFFLGSVSQNVVTHAGCSVRIARAGAAPVNESPRIIVGYDASEESERAVEAIARRHWPPGTSVRVVTVAEQKSLGFFASHFHKADWQHSDEGGTKSPEVGDLVRNLATKACERLRAAGLKAEAMGQEGDPKKVLLDMAEEWKAHCIFVGARGHRAHHGKSLGAVATLVANRAHCSVEIVRSNAATLM